MTFYLVLLGAILLLSVITQPSSGLLNRRVFAVMSFGLLAAVSAVRTCDVGADTHQYCTYYPIIGSMGWDEASALRYEPGFFLMNKALYLISSDPQILLAVSSVIIIGGIGYYVYSSGVSIALAISFFVLLQGYAMSMAWMRQSIATAIIAVAVPRLAARKPLGFIVAVIIASQFHSSALVVLVLIPLAWLRPRARLLAAVSGFSVLLWAASGAIFSLVVERTGLYEGYLDDIATGGGKLGVLLEAVFFLLCVGFMVYAHGLDGSVPQDAAEVTRDFSLMAAWMVIPAVALAYGSNAYLRLILYFIPVLSVGLAQAGESSRRADTRLVLGTVLALALGYFVAISYLRPEWFRVTPFEWLLP